LSGDDEPVRLGTGVELAGAARRLVRIEGETVPPGRLADHHPADLADPGPGPPVPRGRLERRKFFDRLVFAGEPDHARHANAYDKAQRERMRLLTDAAESGQPADAVWLTALEARLGQAGADGRRPGPAPCWPCRPRSTVAATAPSPAPAWP
jgi:DNA replication and repair protein RecF